MNRGWVVAMVGLFVGFGAPQAAPVSPVRLLQVERVTVRVRHRVFGEFAEIDTVRLRQDFRIGDTPYSARVVEFVPDFFMDVKKHKVSSRSNQPKNPAFRIVVRQKGVPQDTTWAFLSAMPHFTRKSMLAFQVLRIDFPDRAPMMADSLPAAAPAKAATP